MKASVVTFFTGTAIRLAALPVLLLGMTGTSVAQASAASASAGKTSAAAQPAQAHAAATAKPVLAQAANAAPRQPGGTHEGITVHGHWTIEVRNPDGKLVSHTEFENALAPNGGAALLAGLLTGTVTPGSWWVSVAIDSGGDSPLIIAEPNSNAAAVCQATFSQPYQVCYDTLSVSGSQLGSGTSGGAVLTGSTVTFTGSASIPTSNYAATAIMWVETAQFICAPSNSPSTCFDIATNAGLPSEPLTARNLDGVGADPPAVKISPGQAILVSVVISFGSGS